MFFLSMQVRREQVVNTGVGTEERERRKGNREKGTVPAYYANQKKRRTPSFFRLDDLNTHEEGQN